MAVRSRRTLRESLVCSTAPASLGIGVLTKGLNRPSDVHESPSAPLRALSVPVESESIVINELLQRFSGYADNLSYHCFPEDYPGFYNSNSFTHGLLHAAGVEHEESPPRRPAPGWLTPVPSSMFHSSQQ